MKKLLLLILLPSLMIQTADAQVQIKPAVKSNTTKLAYPPSWSYVSNIYEVNIRQYTPSGTINEFSTHLPRLQQMGVDILWIMPVQPIGAKARKGSLGSYYSIKDYMGINPEMGSMEDWINMVQKAHDLGMKVILDWVGNHTAFDHYWTVNHPEYYVRDEKGQIKSPVDDWSDVADLNYDNKEMRQAMIQNMKFWLDASHIDGFRCDVAYMVPTDFWQDARRQLEMAKPGLFMLAEAEDMGLHKEAFDMSYGWKFHHLTVDIAKGKKNVNDIRTYIEEMKLWPPNAFTMYFTDNHDENSWQKTTQERYGDAHDAFAVLSFGMKGMPLIYSGQEANNAKVLRFFDKDTLDLSSFPKADFYARLIKLKKQELALMHGERGGELINVPNGKDESVFTFLRRKESSKVLFVLNLSAKAQKVKLNSMDIEGNAVSIFDSKGSPVAIKNGMSITLAPWQYIVYQYKN